MNHRPITVLISLGIIAAVVGGVVSSKWKVIPPQQIAQTEITPRASTTSESSAASPLFVPMPIVGPGAAEAADGTASIAPTIIAVSEPTDVTVTIQITDTRLIVGSVNLQRLGSAGQVSSVLGTLNDDGINGDAIAGDRVFSIRTRLTEATPARFQVSWALRGVLKRAVSNSVSVLVVVLPSDPGGPGTATLGGIDSDGDGVRDDVQRYIALTYSSSAKMRTVLTTYAKATQAGLMSSSDAKAANDAALRAKRAIDCLFYIDSNSAPDIQSSLEAQILNTKERILADNKAAGLVSVNTLSAPSPDNPKSSCEFDPDSLSN